MIRLMRPAAATAVVLFVAGGLLPEGISLFQSYDFLLHLTQGGAALALGYQISAFQAYVHYGSLKANYTEEGKKKKMGRG